MNRAVGWLLLLLLFVACYADTLSRLVKDWLTYDYAYGFVVFGICLFMVWGKRAEWPLLAPRPSPFLGGAIVALGCAALILGKLSGTLVLKEASLIVAISGLILLLLGTDHYRAHWVPIVYLVFTLSLPGDLLNRYSLQLQNAASNVAAVLLRMTGMPVLLRQHYLDLPHISLDVARECNGVNHIMAIMSLAIPMTYFSPFSLLRKVIVAVFAFFLGIFLNGLRVAMIGWWSVSHKELHGPGSIFFTTSMFFVGFVIMAAFSYTSFGRKEHAGKVSITAEKSQAAADKTWRAPLSFAIGIVLLSVTAGVLHMDPPPPVRLGQSLGSFPRLLGGWMGKDLDGFGGRFDASRPDDVLNRSYFEADGRRMDVYLAYFAAQDEVRKVSNLVFERLHERAKALEVPCEGRLFRVLRTSLPGRGSGRVAYYWYNVDGRSLVSKVEVRAWTALNTIVRRRSNGAVIVVAPGPDDPNADAGGSVPDDQIEFLELMIPQVRRSLASE